MSREDKDVLRGLQHEVLGLLFHWRIFIQMYGASEENIDVLKGVADEFFGTVQQLLWDHVLLTIGKLTDPAETLTKQENLSVEKAINLLSSHETGFEIKDLKAKLETLREKCRLIKKIRHKRLAHFGKEYMIDRLSQTPLPGVNRTTVEESLTLIIEIMNAVEKGFGTAKLIYSLPERPVGEDLIWYLKESGSYREVRDKAKNKKMKDLGFK